MKAIAVGLVQESSFQMPRIDWKQAIERWHALLPVEQQARRIEAILRYVANSMAFEGDPLLPEWRQAQQKIFDAKAVELGWKAAGEGDGEKTQ